MSTKDLTRLGVDFDEESYSYCCGGGKCILESFASS